MSWYEFLPALLNMSMTASLIILAVLVVRLLLKKAPKVFSYALWAVVLFRLLCPVSISSDFSLLGAFQVPVEDGAAEYIPVNIVHTENPQVTLPSLGDWAGAQDAKAEDLTADGSEAATATGETSSGVAVGEQSGVYTATEPDVATDTTLSLLKQLETYINSHLPQGSEQLGADPLEAPVTIATYIWGLGALALLTYNLVHMAKLRKSLQIAEPMANNIYLADHIDTPFVMGLMHPKIYLPSTLKEQERSYIILHEQYHIRRGDHVVKVLAFAALCIHWFNPLVWLAFVLATKDMEMSCDEAVMKQMKQDIRAEYAQSLLQLATGRRLIAGAPLAFGEGDTKARVKNVMHYKKPAFWLVLLAVAVCVVAVVCLVTNPKEKSSVPLPTGQSFGCALRTYNATGHSYDPAGEVFFYITKDGHLKGKGLLHSAVETQGWVDLGLLEEVELTAQNYDYLFKTYGSSTEKYEVKKIEQGATRRYGVEKAWQVIGDKEDVMAWNYYLLYLENGSWGLVCWDGDEEYGAVKWMIDLAETEWEIEDVQVGTTYCSIECLYMNPLSSFLPVNGDSGYWYRFEADAFVEIQKSSGDETRTEVESWMWQEFPYTDEEWEQLYWPNPETQTNISEYYEEMLYMPIDNRQCLMKMDEQLWLVTISNDPKAGKYIWSIYSLAPEDEAVGQDASEGVGDSVAGQEVVPTVYDLTVGTTYRTSEFVEYSIFTTSHPFYGDSGYLYELTGQEFIIRNKTYGTEERFPVSQWGWQELPYTDEEWNEIVLGSHLSDIRSTFTEVLYQPISEKWFILRVDGILLLAEMLVVREQLELGEVYTLVPEGQKENTHLVQKEFEKYYEQCPEGVYPAEAWLDEEGGLTTPFDWRERGDIQIAENRVGYYIPKEAMDRVGTAELLATVVEWRHLGFYSSYNFLGDYLYTVTQRFNAMEEVLKRPDMAEALLAEYKEDGFPIIRTFGDKKEQEAYDEETWFYIEKIATEEILLASNYAFDRMDEAMKQEVLAEALKKVELRQSGRFQCGYKDADGEISLSEFPSGFFAYILEQEEYGAGSKWYKYLVESGETELVEKLDSLGSRQCWP